MRTDEITTILAKPNSQALLQRRDIARLAYVAKDGTPRVVPVSFTWNGAEAVMCTTTNAPKLASLRRNPSVSLTIDTEVHPPRILLIRGAAVLDEVEGIPEEYLQMNGSYQMTPEQRVEWEAGVRELYHSMVPSAVEELVRRRRSAEHRSKERPPPQRTARKRRANVSGSVTEVCSSMVTTQWFGGTGTLLPWWSVVCATAGPSRAGTSNGTPRRRMALAPARLWSHSTARTTVPSSPR